MANRLPNLLYLAHRVPYPPDKGDRIRSFHTLRFLAESANVHVACLADEPVPPGAVAALERRCARVAVVPVGPWARRARAAFSLLCGRPATLGAFDAPTLHRTLDLWSREIAFDVCVAFSSSMAPYLRAGGLRGVPAVVDLCDVDSEKWFDYAAAGGPAAWLHRLEGRRLRRLERELATWARGVVLTTPAEVAVYERFAGPGTAVAVANGVDLAAFRPAAPSSELSLVFVGALDYRPNVDGIVWFCSEVWPRLCQHRRDARLFVVGRRPVAAVRRLGRMPGVEVVGTVPDVRPWLARAAVAVVPLRIARGVQNKVLEALAMAKAVVASPLCLQGLAAEPGRHLLTASDPGEWEEAVLRLLDDGELRRRLGEAGRTFVEEHHRWERCLAPLRELVVRAACGLAFAPPTREGGANAKPQAARLEGERA